MMAKIVKRRKLPVKVLLEFFAYDQSTGEIRYRPNRDRRWFKSDRLWKSWNAQWGGKIATSNKNSKSAGPGYPSVAVNQRHYLAHRVIWAMMTGKWPVHEIDHINQNRLDNRWCNLRAATRGQNSLNMLMPSHNTSGVTGVEWFKPAQLWKARGRALGCEVIKYAKTFEEAVALREQIKRQLKMTDRHGLPRTG